MTTFTNSLNLDIHSHFLKYIFRFFGNNLIVLLWADWSVTAHKWSVGISGLYLSNITSMNACFQNCLFWVWAFQGPSCCPMVPEVGSFNRPFPLVRGSTPWTPSLLPHPPNSSPLESPLSRLRLKSRQSKAPHSHSEWRCLQTRKSHNIKDRVWTFFRYVASKEFLLSKQSIE